ncbi:MAG: hypothetical protein ACYCX4_01055, partial [Bacillota bacterium]
EGLDISPDEMRGNSVTKAIAQAGGNLGDILEKAQDDNDLQGKAQQLENKGLIMKALKTTESDNPGKSSGAPGQIKKGATRHEEGWEDQFAEEASSVPQSIYGTGTKEGSKRVEEIIKSFFPMGAWGDSRFDGSSWKGKEPDIGNSSKSSEKDRKDKKEVNDKEQDTGKSDSHGANSGTDKKKEK